MRLPDVLMRVCSIQSERECVLGGDGLGEVVERGASLTGSVGGGGSGAAGGGAHQAAVRILLVQGQPLEGAPPQGGRPALFVGAGVRSTLCIKTGQWMISAFAIVHRTTKRLLPSFQCHRPLVVTDHYSIRCPYRHTKPIKSNNTSRTQPPEEHFAYDEYNIFLFMMVEDREYTYMCVSDILHKHKRTPLCKHNACYIYMYM